MCVRNMQGVLAHLEKIKADEKGVMKGEFYVGRNCNK